MFRKSGQGRAQRFRWIQLSNRVYCIADQWLGIVVTKVLCKRSFESPEDVADACMEELTPLASSRSEGMFATIVKGERDWGFWLSPLGSTPGGAFQSRQGIWAPHSFSYKLRQDLLAFEQALLEEEVP